MRRRSALLALTAALLLCASAGAQPSPDQSLRTFLRGAFGADRQNYPDTRYARAWADLNGDGRDEAIVYLVSGNSCGSGGCHLYVYAPAGRSWRQAADISIVNPPVRLLATRTRGWRDIAVRVSGGGISGYEARLAFDGRGYPENPSTPPARRIRGSAPGRVLIADGDRGRPLF